MNLVQNSGPGSSVRSRESATCTPRMRARWSARSRCLPSSVSEVAARLSIGALSVFGHDPCVAAAAALGAVDDQGAILERNPRQPPGRDVSVRAGEDERAEILV